MELKEDGSRFPSMPNFRQVVLRRPPENLPDGKLNLYISSHPDMLTMAEIQELQKMCMRCVIDCRAPQEYESAIGSKILDEYYPLYEVKFPGKGYTGTPGETITAVPLKSGDAISVTATEELRHGNVGSSLPRRVHLLCNFFDGDYVLTMLRQLPWYLCLYGIICILLDLVFRTDSRFFSPFYTKYILNPGGLDRLYQDIITYCQRHLCGGKYDSFYTEALKGHRKKKKVERIPISFERNIISFERNNISFERNRNSLYFFFLPMSL